MSIHYTQAMSAVIISFLASQGVSAATVTDSRGNVGYDTLAQCEAAAAAGTAKTYQPFTRNQPSLRKGETSMTVLPLKDVSLTPDVVKFMNFSSNSYLLGSCDLGVGPKGTQSGVSKALQGKYVYFGPDTPVNVYRNKEGFPVRATMQQCDNRFALDLPRPIAAREMAAVPSGTANAPLISSTQASHEMAAVGLNAAGATATAAVAPAAVESGVLLAAGPIALTQALGVFGLVAAGGAVLLNNSGDSGTTGTTGTTP